MHLENAEILIRQLESMSFLVAESFQATSDVKFADLEGIFSEAGVSMPTQPSAPKQRAQGSQRGVSRPEMVLGPGQKERQAMILDKIRQSGNCRTSELHGVLPDLSERTLRYDLQRLVEQGKIERGGAGPASWYRLKDAPTIDGSSQTGLAVERNVSQEVSL